MRYRMKRKQLTHRGESIDFDAGRKSFNRADERHVERTNPRHRYIISRDKVVLFLIRSFSKHSENGSNIFGIQHMHANLARATIIAGLVSDWLAWLPQKEHPDPMQLPDYPLHHRGRIQLSLRPSIFFFSWNGSLYFSFIKPRHMVRIASKACSFAFPFD